MRLILLITFLNLSFQFNAQQRTGIEVVFNQAKVELNLKVSEDQMKFTKIKLYIGSRSEASIRNNNVDSAYSYHLFDLSDSSTHHLEFQTASEIDFILGVDSLTNMKGPTEGDLDPLNGMYWAWQSGYINVKIEGKYLAENGEILDLTYHLGGFLHGHLAATTLQLEEVRNSKTLILDLGHFFNSFDFKKLPFVMSPGPEAQNLNQLLAKSIKLK